MNIRPLLTIAAVVALVVLLAGAVTALALSSDPAGHWTWQRSLPQADTLNGVYVAGAGDVWAVGDAGAVIHTTDAGVTWQSLNTDGQHDLSAIDFRGSDGWIAGDAGQVLRSSDAGATWSQVALGVSPSFSSIAFVDAQNGWVGTRDTWNVFHTSDGGATWARQFPAGTTVRPATMWPAMDIAAVSFGDAQHGWAVGGIAYRFGSYWGGTGRGTLLHTSNAGSTWDIVRPAGCQYLSDVVALGVHSAVACGADDSILRSDDDGATWTRVYGGDGERLTALAFATATDGWAVGQQNEVLHTSDGGLTWEQQVTPAFPTRDLLDVGFSDAQHGWAVGEAGAVMRTTDGGAHWTWVSTPAEGGVADVGFADAQRGVAVGQRDDGVGVLETTTDGGSTWLPATAPALPALHGVDWAGGEAWAVGDYGAVVHSTDGGATWQRQATHDGETLFDVSFGDVLHGWALPVESWGHLLATTDGGVTWHARDIVAEGLTYSEIYDLDFTDALHGWLVGDAMSATYRDTPMILRTTDGGAAWQRVGPRPRGVMDFSGVSFVDADHGWVVGGRAVYMTSDGGVSWTRQNTGLAGAYLYDTEFVDATHGWALSEGGMNGRSTLLATIDGGLHWGAATTGCDAFVGGLDFVDALHGWLAADSGAVLHTSDGGGIGPFTGLALAGATLHQKDTFVNNPVTLTLSCADDGLDVGACEYRLDGGPWTTGTSLTLPAPADHANDGLKTVLYRSTDGAGTIGPVSTYQVVIDTGRPRVTAPRSTGVRSGGLAVLRIGAQDALSPWLRVAIDITDARGRVVKHKGTTLVPGDMRLAFSKVAVRCDLPRGHYRLVVTAHDWAGNRQVRVASGSLNVTGGGGGIHVDPAKDALVKEGIHSIQIGVQSWAVDHGDQYPPASAVTRSGAVSFYVDNWPTNPFTGKPMAPGDAPGTYRYQQLDGGASFRLVGHLSDGSDFVVP